MLGLASSVVAVVAIVANEIRDRRRLQHEREMQQLKIEERRWSTLRDERIRAYATLARLTKRVDESVENPELPAVVEAHSAVGLLAENPKLREVAEDLVRTWEGAWMSVRDAIDAGNPDLYDAPGYKNARDRLRTAFIEPAKDKIGAKRCAPRSRLNGSQGGPGLPAPTAFLTPLSWSQKPRASGSTS
jgi:hypothetical protein